MVREASFLAILGGPVCFPKSPHCEVPQDILVAPEIDLPRQKVLRGEYSCTSKKSQLIYLNLELLGYQEPLWQSYSYTKKILTRVAISTNKTIILSQIIK